jgi:hypothetical protein
LHAEIELGHVLNLKNVNAALASGNLVRVWISFYYPVRAKVRMMYPEEV